MSLLKLFKYKDNIIIISDCYDERSSLGGLCLYNNLSNRDLGNYYKDWDKGSFKEIDSVTLKNLSDSRVKFHKSCNGWFTVGKYLVGEDEIIKLEEFLDEYQIPESKLKLTNIDSITLKNKK